MSRTGSWLALAALALLPAAVLAGYQDHPPAPPRPDQPDPWVEAHLGEFVTLYEHLHSHPELSNREILTSQRIADELRKAGAAVTTGVGRLGVVGVLKNGRGPIVLVRADMDALAVTEQTGLPYASQVKATDESGKTNGVMHACGHDVHMTCLVGTARWLAEHKAAWAGTVVLIGQPAEEAGGGARRMVNDGLYTRFPRPDYAIALHVQHDLEAGKIGYCSGPAMAGTTAVSIVVHGKGGHGAMPQDAVDPVVLAAALVLDLQTIVSREINPVDPAVVTVGMIHGGSESNVIPDEVELNLTLRSFREEVRKRLVTGIQRRAAALAQGHGAPAPEVFVGGGVPPLVNTPALVDRIVPALARVVGAEDVQEIDPTMAAEDFGYFGQGGIPTFMFRLGTAPADAAARARSGGPALPALHSPQYHPDTNPTLRTGIRSMTSAVVELLPPAAGSAAPAGSGGAAPLANRGGNPMPNPAAPMRPEVNGRPEARN